ncbi:putative nuclear serine protease HtrA2/Nma111 [Stachybotrys elegans]|uniref:Nuclear serine protease HtrA2/Nma111 n=1 Tax=Stachybotrys elegans TaxID=80388 RepID=A0A8K0WJ72_9HYPO|nr:putative nuclear serine protease HtrA2/Nma111 [Stachybotrys elegans]
MNGKQGQTRPKRKASLSEPQLAKRQASERPSKEDSPDVDLPDRQDKTSNLAADPMLCPGMPGGPDKWEDTIKRVASSVVAIRFSHPRSFDAETAMTGEATGFVVDAKRGKCNATLSIVTLYTTFGNSPAAYNDFNTCYYQASAAATGGSSGSPVIAKDGSAVALQAGGRTDKASTDFFLPLDRPLRALQCIQQGKPVTRGDIQCQFVFQPFDECRRLGLSPKWEAAMRQAFPYETNMLVAETIKAGDVLIKVNDQLITQFIRLDDIMDSSVDQTVNILLQRGGKDVKVDIKVGDLHKITPDRFVTVAGASFHDLSYQQARIYAIPVQGVYVCESAGSFQFDGSNHGCIIQTVDYKDVPDLNTFIKVMKGIPDRARVAITYKHLSNLHTRYTGIINIDRHWSVKMTVAIRNDKSGLWDFSDLGSPLPPSIPQRRSASFIKLDNMPNSKIAELVQSSVHVSCVIPIKLDGFPKDRQSGMGLVIDAEKGLVLISRAIVPYDLCDITVTIADNIFVEGKVVFLHPLQNYAVIQYDSSLVDAPVKSASLSDEYLKQGAKTYFFGYNGNNVYHGSTSVIQVMAGAMPANLEAPRYRAVNFDAIVIDSPLAEVCNSGVLVAPDGAVQALWLTCLSGSCHSERNRELAFGLGTASLLPVIKAIQKGDAPKLRIILTEFSSIPMSKAFIMGVDNGWIDQVTNTSRSRHQLFMVRKCAAERINQPVSLLEGDIILTLNGKICTNISDFDIMYYNDILKARIVRNRKEMELEIQTVSTDNIETDYIVSFCGALFHRPHQAVYFCLKAVTFDLVPWVITMKKNDHYFPTTVWFKDTNEPCGWRRILHEGNMASEGRAIDGVPSMAEDVNMG